MRITYFSRGSFARAPQQGAVVERDWHTLSRWLSTPTFAPDKRAAGAWCPCALPGGVVKDNAGPLSLLVGDVDEAGPSGMARSVAALSEHAGLIIPTFSATLENEKHRIVLALSRALEPDEFRIAWPFWCSALADLGIPLDRGCKNPNRLYFACVARTRATWLGARTLTGRPVAVDAMLASARHDIEMRRRRDDEQKRRLPSPAPVQSRDRYLRGALERARGNVLASVDPGRHECLLKEAYSLARLELSEDDIRAALLDAFVAVAGVQRQREGERAIRDAVGARRKGAA